MCMGAGFLTEFALVRRAGGVAGGIGGGEAGDDRVCGGCGAHDSCAAAQGQGAWIPPQRLLLVLPLLCVKHCCTALALLQRRPSLSMIRL